jgi:hypothetical protein
MNTRARRLLVSAVLLASLTVGPASGEDITASPPRFNRTTREPVLLRYGFRPGERSDVDADVSMLMSLKLRGQSVRIATQMKMAFSCDVVSVDASGNARVDVKLTRVQIEVNGPQTLRYDSKTDTAPALPELKYLAAMLNQNVPCTVTPRGEVSDVNLHFMREALRRANALALLDSVEDTLDQTLQGAFIQLAEEPVAVGDVYRAGTMSQKAEGIGSMTALISYRVHSVSADKKGVVLKPVITFQTDLPSGCPVTIESIDADGWILFDRVRGDIDRSFARVKIKMSASENGESLEMTTDVTIKFATSYPKRQRPDSDVPWAGPARSDSAEPIGVGAGPASAQWSGTSGQIRGS